MADRPYSRVYWTIVDDPKFATIYDDNVRLATWLRLLIVAEQAHPASAYIPEGTNRNAMKALVEAGLVDIGTGRRFRVHGLASEREMRSQSARNAAAVRWHSERNVRSDAGDMLAKTRRDEHRQDEQNGAQSAFKREFAPARPRHNTVDSDPHLREYKAAILENHGKGMDEPTVEPLPLRKRP